MSGSCWGSDEAEDEVAEPAEATPEVTECTTGCPCDAFARYNDPFSANYAITNCAGLASRLRDKWGNLRVGQIGTFFGADGSRIESVMTVDGLRNAARAAGAFTDRGADITSPAAGNPCDILFSLWVLRAGKWGVQLSDKNGAVVLKGTPNQGEDFHIVSTRLDKDGNIPADVYSTNGQRPFEGPRTMPEWVLATGMPITNQPQNATQFVEMPTAQSGFDAYTSADIPPNSVVADTGAAVFDPNKFYYRLDIFNDDQTPEAFIIDDEFMKTFTSSA